MATRGYVEVKRKGGKGTVHTPSGGRFTGATFEVKVPPGTGKGWYRTQYGAGFRGGPSISGYKLTKVDPAKEAERLRGLNKKAKGYARTGSPGVAGYQHRAEAADSAARVRTEHNDNFATLMDRAAEKSAPKAKPAPPNVARSSRSIAVLTADEREQNDDLTEALQETASWVGGEYADIAKKGGVPLPDEGDAETAVESFWESFAYVDTFAFEMAVQAFTDALRSGASVDDAEHRAHAVGARAQELSGERQRQIRAEYTEGPDAFLAGYVKKTAKRRTKRRNNPGLPTTAGLVGQLKF